MKSYTLSPQEVQQLRAEHRLKRGKRPADRLKAVVLLGSGRSAKQVAEALLIDADTVRGYYKRYRRSGVRGLAKMEYRGSAGWHDEEQLVELDLHLQQKLYLSAKDVVRLVKARWGIAYSERGVTALLHRLGYVYKKPKLVPGKANAEAQRRFLESYENLKETKAPADPIYFMDATHHRHNPVLGYGWIKRGVVREIPSNTGRDRLNIKRAIDLERLQPVVRFDDTINAASTIALFEQLEAANPAATQIYIICDNARYYRSKDVRHFLEDSKITLLFLPSYSPNPNLIQRYWKFFKKQVLYDAYYETLSKFNRACAEFFRNSNAHAPQLRSLLTENFQIVGN